MCLFVSAGAGSGVEIAKILKLYKMNKEQEKFWKMLSKKYPEKENRSCWNCDNIMCSEVEYPCNNCHRGPGEKDLTEWKWSGEQVKYSDPFPWDSVDE